VVTVIYLVQIEPNNRFETEKVKKGYRHCGYLPQTPTSQPNIQQLFMSHARIKKIKTQRAPREYHSTASEVQPEHGRSLRQDKRRPNWKLYFRRQISAFSGVTRNLSYFLPFRSMKYCMQPYHFELARLRASGIMFSSFMFDLWSWTLNRDVRIARLGAERARTHTWERKRERDSENDDDNCFNYHSWRNNIVIAFGTLSSFLT